MSTTARNGLRVTRVKVKCRVPRKKGIPKEEFKTRDKTVARKRQEKLRQDEDNDKTKTKQKRQ